MIVYSGKYTVGEQGGGLEDFNAGISSADRTRTFRLIQTKQNNTYRIEIDGHHMKLKGRPKDRNFVIEGPGIYGFDRGHRPQFGDRIKTKFPHDEDSLQELIDHCLDNTVMASIARDISTAIRGELARMPGLGFKGPHSGLYAWTRPGEPQSGGRHESKSRGAHNGLYRKGFDKFDYRT